MSGQTFAQKALARAAGLASVEVGQVVDARPDIVLSHDNTAAIRRIWLQFGQQRVVIPERIAITLDHAVPAPTTKHAQNHAEIRQFVQEQGIRYFFEVGRGICHQVLSEEAIVLPGQLILGADSHTTHFGWLGAFGAGIGRSEVAALWATGELWLRVPESMKVVLEGELPVGVTAKDFALRLIGDLGADGGLYMSIEFHGSGIEAMSLESRMVLPNMMAEFGAKNAWIAPDTKTTAYLAERMKRKAADSEQRFGTPGTPLSVAELQALLASMALFPDPDATYAAVHHYRAADLEPYIACPHSVDNVVPLSAVAGTRVQQAFLGTCTNGRLEDLAAAANVIRGRRVAPGVRFIVIPASSEVLKAALERGYIQDFVEAGAVIGVPGCGPCMGNHMGIPAPGEVTISSANRNFRGRMGTPDSEIYLANPAVVAATAVAGVIVDPREIGG
ncbi:MULTISPECIES: 3-isopropylmalate dehydratase large subunit [Caldilinea]|uniref:3-isopropylmalate dehydratase large subunit n=1 Tax=Caldilinea aerophila (strain DSM 14535 / JCM 11387 / NBRC 104270 / STL-6-O1) TaxID=926550 RepID=I0HZT2_CALAS|nr:MULTISPECIES: 3-isopropylmalate dehydratase large subunit [Caldilinea]BAL98519.1 3-isopropylmalate dehydratase large subunit [Caldilinea aerophila DSM 14535 = NBRC 104270]GIV74902.1 MAG: 3-isopropylmalate dehydratase large subunit [Caldilinea sp.]